MVAARSCIWSAWRISFPHRSGEQEVVSFYPTIRVAEARLAYRPGGMGAAFGGGVFNNVDQMNNPLQCEIR
jgi:hypothetical protein